MTEQAFMLMKRDPVTGKTRPGTFLYDAGARPELTRAQLADRHKGDPEVIGIALVTWDLAEAHIERLRQEMETQKAAVVAWLHEQTGQGLLVSGHNAPAWSSYSEAQRAYEDATWVPDNHERQSA